MTSLNFLKRCFSYHISWETASSKGTSVLNFWRFKRPKMTIGFLQEMRDLIAEDHDFTEPDILINFIQKLEG